MGPERMFRGRTAADCNVYSAVWDNRADPVTVELEEWALALSGKSEFILTEDDDLLVLDPWRGIRIMRLFQFIADHPLSGAG